MLSIQADIDLCRKEYKKQKKLEEFVSKRQLKRPNTNKWQVIVLFSFALPLFLGALVFSFLLITAEVFRIILFIFLSLLIFELYIRFCLIQTVKCYQHYAKEETRRRCMCVPSCSEYAIICLEKIFPLTVALLKIRKRLYKTCKGEDYKLDFPFKKMNAEFEKKYLN